MTSNPTTPHIRWMVRRDMPEVTSIESQCYHDPWSEGEFIDILRKRSVIGMVAEAREKNGDNTKIVGYMVYELYKHRIDLLNLAVHPSHRKQGVGRAMVQKLKHKLSPTRRKWITAYAAEHNLNGQLFFRALGFRVVKTSRGFYDMPDGTSEDAYLFQYRLTAAKLASMECVKEQL
jgi:ribosomal-protein-alanine N-acetyltransferase